MATFLNLLASDLLKREIDFASLKVIFPNKRAGLFLADELGKHIDRPIWMPEILTLDEFIDKYSGLRRLDETEAVIKLYRIFLNSGISEEKMSLGDFYYWGKMLLGDFDDVDKYMVNPHDLFANVDSYRQMDDGTLDYLDPAQKEALSSFFRIIAEKRSDETESFEKLWNHLEDLYDSFNKELLETHCAYTGMAQRKFVEDELWPEQKMVVFAGFNALNRCERSIFTHYKEAGSALFYWDYDTFYTNNPHHEAGWYMRQNLKDYPNALGVEFFNNIAVHGPEIQVVDVPMKIAQTKLISQLLGENPGRETAVVLCDESMLIPIRSSIPERVRNVNVTMGFPAKNSSVSGLISLLYTLSLYDHRKDTYYYKPVLKILAHPLVRGGDMKSCDALVESMNKDNLFRVSSDKLDFDPVVKAIFNRGHRNVSEWLLDIIEKILSGEAVKSRSMDEEILFSLYNYLKRLQDLLVTEGLSDYVIRDDKFYISMVTKLLSYISVPFEGQPLEGMQLMGMMETRMLDFKHVILLSVNEGIMPKGGVAPSFVPYNFRKVFGMPVPEHSDSIYAYYFYRLLQRARHVDIMYVSVKDDAFGAEMSRFILQLKYESPLRIKWSSLRNEISIENSGQKPMQKHISLLEKIENKYIGKKKLLSPSALSDYLQCPRRFFYKYGAGLYESETVGDDMDARMLGNLFHDAACTIYRDLRGSHPSSMITEEALSGLIGHPELISGYVDRSFMKIISSDEHLKNLSDSGYNDMAKKTVHTYLLNLLKYDRHNCAPFSILKLEENLSMPVRLSDGREVNVGGIVDRIDNVGGTIRIIDYKTGGDTLVFKDIESLFDIEAGTHVKVPFQTMLYGLAFMASGQALTVTPGAYILREMNRLDYNCRFVAKGGVLNNMDADTISKFKELLIRTLDGIFSGAGSEIEAGSETNCRYCPYLEVCK